jgi:uncharacterized protein with HEPN domain
VTAGRFEIRSRVPEHILLCLQRIRENASSGRDVVNNSHTLQDAILRNLQVFCESAQRLSGECKAQHPEVDWRAMSGFRNVLVHDYFGIDFGVVWSAVEKGVPRLRTRSPICCAAWTALKGLSRIERASRQSRRRRDVLVAEVR